MSLEKDLWGNDIIYHEPLPEGNERKKTEPKGYAAPPGTGPKGETCKSCKFYAIRKFSKSYRKCLKVRGRWTRGPGTDILAKSPACHYWENNKT